MIQKTYSQNGNRLKNFETKLTVTKGETLEGGIDGEAGIGIYTLLDTKLIGSKDLPLVPTSQQ